jgi:hypothetical protein
MVSLTPPLGEDVALARETLRDDPGVPATGRTAEAVEPQALAIMANAPKSVTTMIAFTEKTAFPNIVLFLGGVSCLNNMESSSHFWMLNHRMLGFACPKFAER